MFFLQKFSDEVTVSTLPHPLSMFLLGFMLFSVLMLYNEYRRTKKDLDEVKQGLKDIEEHLRSEVSNVDSKLAELSRKVDSRVDKAIVALKKKC